jgi:hypothetical protein
MTPDNINTIEATEHMCCLSASHDIPPTRHLQDRKASLLIT